jgi:alpha-tubulin suppressor-like RCC1 family protein
MQVRHGVLAMALVMVAVLIAVGGQASAETAGRLNASPSAPMASEQIAFTGSLPIGGGVPLRLQVRTSTGGWSTLSSFGSRPGGDFTVMEPAVASTGTSRIYRVRAAGRALFTPARTVTTVAQTGYLAVKSDATADTPLPMKATFTPARPGRRVQFQRRQGDGFQAFATVVEDAAGVARVTDTVRVNTGFTYRAVATVYRGAAAKVSNAALVTFNRWLQVSTGGRSSCGVMNDRSGWCWGSNAHGQLGNGTTVSSAKPVRLSGRWDSTSVGPAHTCGLKADDTAWCWGSGSDGSLGQGTATDSTVPVLVPVSAAWRSIDASGVGHTCAVTMINTAWCWGRNGLGQLGTGTLDDSSAPVQVPGAWRSVDTSEYASCGVQTDNTGWCWGRSAARYPDARPTPVQVPGAWKSLTAGRDYWCGVQVDDTGWCIGQVNAFGELGDGTHTTDGALPSVKRVQLPGTWSSVVAGAGTTCGVRTDATGWCWGRNTSGGLGAGDTTNRLRPVQVPGKWLAWGSSPGAHACAVRTWGSAWCAGANASGQLGDGSTMSSSVYVRIYGPR